MTLYLFQRQPETLDLPAMHKRLRRKVFFFFFQIHNFIFKSAFPLAGFCLWKVVALLALIEPLRHLRVCKISFRFTISYYKS